MIYAIYTVSILAGLALITWFASDTLNLWFPERFEKIKQWFSSHVLRSPKDASSQHVRDAALHIASHSLGQGKSAAEAVEDAIEHIRSRTKEWKNENEVRAWLESKLNVQRATGVSPMSTMKTANLKRALVLLLIGILIGFAGGWMARPVGRAGDRYSIHTVSGASRIRAIKLDRKSGETWIMDLHGRWTNSPPRQ